MTPVADGLVGVAVLTGRRATFPELLSAFPTLTPRIEGNPVTRVRGAGPLRQRSTRRVRGRVLLVGDAAGYVDALTGEGIAVGIAQARAAVAAIVAGDPGGYERAWHRVTRRHDLLTRGLLTVTRHDVAAPPDRARRRPRSRGCSTRSSTSWRDRHELHPNEMLTSLRFRRGPRMSAPEQVVLLDESGHAVGVADKATVHHRDTPLHLAFSCYVLSAAGEVLVTRRALTSRRGRAPGPTPCADIPRPASPSSTPCDVAPSPSSASPCPTYAWWCRGSATAP